MFFALVFAAVLAVQLGGYALYRSYKASADRLAANDLRRSVRPRADGWDRMVGAHNRLGED